MGSLRLVEFGEEVVLILRCNPLKVPQRLSTVWCQVKRVCAPVGEIGAALGEAATLKIVDESDHCAAMDSQRDAQGLLGLAVASADVTE